MNCWLIQKMISEICINIKKALLRLQNLSRSNSILRLVKLKPFSLAFQNLSSLHAQSTIIWQEIGIIMALRRYQVFFLTLGGMTQYEMSLVFVYPSKLTDASNPSSIYSWSKSGFEVFSATFQGSFFNFLWTKQMFDEILKLFQGLH